MNKNKIRRGWGEIVRHYSVRCVTCGIEFRKSRVSKPVFNRLLIDTGYIKTDDGIMCGVCFVEMERNEESEYRKRLERQEDEKRNQTNGKQEDSTDV